MSSTPSLPVSQYSPAFITRRGISARSNNLNLARRSERSELLPLSPVERNILSGDHKMKKLAAGLSCSAARGSVLPNNRQRLTAVSLGPRIRRVGLDTVSLR